MSHLVFLESSQFPRREKIYNRKQRQRAISEQVFMIFGHYQNHQNLTFKRLYHLSAKKIMIQKLFLWENKRHIVVVLVPNFYLSGRPSSYFLPFFPHVYGEPYVIFVTLPITELCILRIDCVSLLVSQVIASLSRLHLFLCMFLYYIFLITSYKLANNNSFIQPIIQVTSLIGP